MDQDVLLSRKIAQEQGAGDEEVPALFPSFVRKSAAMNGELRKRSTGRQDRGGPWHGCRPCDSFATTNQSTGWTCKGGRRDGEADQREFNERAIAPYHSQGRGRGRGGTSLGHLQHRAGGGGGGRHSAHRRHLEQRILDHERRRQALHLS